MIHINFGIKSWGQWNKKWTTFLLTCDSLFGSVFQFKFDRLKSLQLVLLYCSGCEHFNHERTICSSEPYTETHIFWRACYGLDFNTNVAFRKNNTNKKQQILFCFIAQDANIFIITYNLFLRTIYSDTYLLGSMLWSWLWHKCWFLGKQH